MSIMETMERDERKRPRARRSFTAGRADSALTVVRVPFADASR
jgi:hypothetical protein